MTCWPPVVTIISSGSACMPSSAITSSMHAFSSCRPSVGPYWSARAHDSVATRVAAAAKLSGGKEPVSGRPPAREMTSGRAVTAIRSRMAEDLMTRVRAANRSA
jgi:hypothetical protein